MHSYPFAIRLNAEVAKEHCNLPVARLFCLREKVAVLRPLRDGGAVQDNLMFCGG
jgi:hypothetical protein